MKQKNQKQHYFQKKVINLQIFLYLYRQNK